jgi:hypothetical protein
VPGFQTFLLMVSVFDAKPLTTVGTNPIEVTGIEPATGCSTDGSVTLLKSVNGIDTDPAVKVTLATPLSSLPRGTVFYAYLCPPCDGSNHPVVTYTVDTANDWLLQAGQPILAGVEDFQVRFFSDPGVPASPCPAGCDVLTGLTGVQIRLINRVVIGLVVRTLHRDPHGIGDRRNEIVTLGHTYTLDAAAKEFSRKQLSMTVRPKNSTDFQ